ncbi:MAG: T9SS type A sorting domain-containing protein [Bacteroidales bacterium]|nr:T9SS type A sorting domain-containing protein [Bacteroidales bacterium]
MKKTMIILLTIASIQICQAQTGCDLVYREYDPNTWVVKTLGDTWNIDIDNDSIADIFWNTWNPGSGAWTFASEFTAVNDWQACALVLQHQSDPNLPNNFYFDASVPLNDTSLVWATSCYAEIYRPYPNSFPLIYKVALRRFDGENYYYGWAEFEEERDRPNYTALLHLSRTCYCTIPNYPLRWGQTSLNTDFEDHEATAFATLHPNPTTGFVTIMGKDLKRAEVFNTLGQRVAVATGEGERITVDISSLPTGIYFVNITDTDGRKCVRKVVKE